MIDLTEHQQQVESAVAFIRSRISEPFEVLIQLGTGLGELARAMQVDCSLNYADIPYFPEATVASHAGNLVVGTLAGKRTAILQGRFHYYEGYTAREVAFPVRVLALLGASTAIITNAGGGLNPTFQPGNIMVLNDHINLLGDNPLRGPNIDAWGPRFPDLSTPYDPELSQLTMKLASRLGLEEVVSGTYVCVPGPSLETPAETRFLRMIGADAVGMSSVPEILVALHAGMRVLGLSVVANVNDPDHFQPILIDDIITAASRAEPRLQQLIVQILAELTP
ncbi:purine-nucleoside phosphorylase [Desulfobulbus oligotrophicus]|jgi:purine-nucleoside phosphorylase|uniref:Purine nucleoside phosphorylase n=1 Tax=Desulfobulbus oligotrophicus TaxID=1909699 RepID=A0A7T5VDA7_9BACT|nr:purine-nucleoside phosphorylase [Desulfobulbus oligotrophicus]MDY0390455.1 purine-nucleoside phosphorylase [Desulfobulbus oligotrophicus]QQG65815.1 purine-nucleoside phosphorylase [Desulfobulbus oligotrophicus]